MKIAFLSHLDLNLYLFRLPVMKELIKQGHKVYAVCPRGEFFDRFNDFGIEAKAYEIDRASLNPLREIRTIKNINKILAKITPDILHTFTHKPNIYGNLTGFPVRINTITGLGSFFVHNDAKSLLIRKIIENLYKITAKTTKKVIFQNRDDMEYFIKKGIIAKQKALLIKGSGIDTKEWQMNNFNIDTGKLNIDKSKPTVLMIARVIKDKGVNEYIKAAEILKNRANFLYVGEIDKGNRNAFVPDWKNVKYLGFRKDIKELISIADIVVLPSYREGIPRTLLEAASMGKPIVTTDTVGCREVVDNGINGFLVPVKDYRALAERIKVLIENKALREEFGRKSREKAEKEFDIKIIVEQYLEVYEEIANV